MSATAATAGPAAPGETLWERWSPGALVAVLVGLHAAAIWGCLGGWAGIAGEWPILQADHGFNYQQARLGSSFVRGSGWAAGYDPGFMAGYPASIFTGTSATLPTLAMTLGGGLPPAATYKATVGLAAALPPALIAWAGALFGLGRREGAWATLLYLLYFWTDFPLNYAGFGMVGFLLVVPTGLVGLGLLVGFLERGGLARWLGAALGLAATFFVNLTSPLVVAGAGLAAYLVATRCDRGGGRKGLPRGRHLGFWALAPAILGLNAPWVLPGFWLRDTVGDTRVSFSHPESVLGRLGAIAWAEPPVQSILIGLGVMGLVALRGARPVAAGALGALAALGLAWGYLAGWLRALDALQPGRQTYAMYAALALAGGFALGEAGRRLRAAGPGRWDRWAALALVLAGVRVFGPAVAARVDGSARGPEPLLASRPHPALLQLIDLLRRHVAPGERLLFEETGLAIPGAPDPFGGQHFSPVLPERAGVEVLGGPFLHAQVRANFTQFGEGKLFGDADWGVEQFTRYARLYRPAAIACWTPKARAFCRNHPDLVRVVDDSGPYTFGRVLGFEGAAVRGSARVEAGPNRLVARDLAPDPADGLVVLRYHWAPGLVADPPVPLEAVALEGDPVPFLALRPAGPLAGPVAIRLALPPR